jgi:hypothetical protein
MAMSFTFVLAYGLAGLAAGLVRGGEGWTTTIGGWFFGLTHNSLTDLTGSNLYALAGLHFFVAIVWAMVYAYLAEPRLPGPGWARGARFGLLPWLISVLVILPLGGGGILGAALGAGPLPVLGNLILHLAFGATLGAVYGPLGDIPADNFAPRAPRDSFEWNQRTELRAAEGIVVGLVVGFFVSLALATVLNAGPGTPLLGIPPAAFVFAWTLLGGALGVLLGSFAGLFARR